MNPAGLNKMLTCDTSYTGADTFLRTLSTQGLNCAVMFSPHFLHIASPHPLDVHLVDWPQLLALLVLDSFAPQQRGQMLDLAATYCPGVWILWQDKNPDDPSLTTL